MNVPEELKYAESHEWVRVEGDVAVVGISDHAQAELTDVVFVDLPKVGAAAKAGSPVATVESVKAASDIYAPVSGEVIEVNNDLTGAPDKVNTEPYASWMFKIRMSNAAELEALKDAAAYRSQIGG
jgi:glycine cleavage system H protein